MAPITLPMNHASTSLSSRLPAPRERGQKAAALQGEARGHALWLTAGCQELKTGHLTVLISSLSARFDRRLPGAPAALGHSTDLFPPTSLLRLL